MKLNISESIRRLRQERNLTQEELASAIGVTAQAVSKWERNEGYPDITLLPEIAEFFGVSLDHLCGRNDRKNRLDEYSICRKSTDAATYEESVAIAREGLAQFPQSYRLKKNLAECLLGCLGRWTPPQDTLDEVIRLYEDIINYCSDTKLCSEASYAICRIYELAGQHEKAADAARCLQSFENSSEFALMNVLQGEELAQQMQTNMIKMIRKIDYMLWKVIDFTDCYSPEEQIILCRKIIDLEESIGDGRDWKIGLVFTMRLYVKTAELYMKLGNMEACMEALRKGADAVIDSDSLSFVGRPESLFLNRIDTDHSTNEKAMCGFMLQRMEDNAAFDPIRNTPEYRVIAERLKEGVL